jgi:hypothetical protein
MAKLKCFVAMAFGRTDTDQWFDKTLRPLLRSVGAQPRRVDRIEHNDDIDDRIYAEIEAADFAVADLTYARQSAYFEAGYAQRAVPVIYTCRADHLKPSTDDSRRVHFDLQMKNIIPWRQPLDSRFRKRMESRLRKVTLPLLRDKARDVEALRQAERFSRLSRSRQLDVAAAAIEASAAKLSLVKGSERDRLQDWGIYIDPVLALWTRFHRSWQWEFKYLVAPSLTLRGLRHIRQELELGKFSPTFNHPQPRGVAEFVILVSLTSVPVDRIRTVFSTWHIVGSSPKQFDWLGQVPIVRPLKRGNRPSSIGSAGRATIPWRSRLVVIDAVRSEEQVTDLVNQIVPTLRDLPKRAE